MDLLLDVPNHQQFEVFSAAGLQASPSTARGALEPLGSQFPIAPPPAAFSALPCRTCTADQSGSVIMLFLWSLFGSSHRGRANETDQRHCAPHFHSAASARHIPMTSNLSRQGVNKLMIPWRIHSWWEVVLYRSTIHSCTMQSCARCLFYGIDNQSFQIYMMVILPIIFTGDLEARHIILHSRSSQSSMFSTSFGMSKHYGDSPSINK